MLTRLRTSWMDSACTITRPGDGEPVWDGEKYVTPPVTVYAGKCLLRPWDSEARVVQAGDRPVSLNTYRLHVPADVEARIDDVVVITGSADDQAVGSTFRVIDVPKDELTTIRVLVVEEQT